MSVTVYVLECLILMAAFTALVLGAMRVNPVSFVGDYPPEIQDAYYRSQGKERVRKKLGVLMIIKKTAAFVVFVFLFAWPIWRGRTRSRRGFFAPTGTWLYEWPSTRSFWTGWCSRT